MSFGGRRVKTGCQQEQPPVYLDMWMSSFRQRVGDLCITNTSRGYQLSRFMDLNQPRAVSHFQEAQPKAFFAQIDEEALVSLLNKIPICLKLVLELELTVF